MSKKIKDNESIQPLINLLQLGELSFFVLDKIPFIYKLSPKIKSFKEQFIEIQNQSSILTLPDQFNELFSKEGWICYGALNRSILEESVKLSLENRIEEAKILLIDSINEESINQILLNIVANAIKFTEQGAVNVTCSLISMENNIAQIKFEIQDTGIGIASENINYIFDTFTQEDASITRKFG